ncbi:hypothetical protein Kpol_534p11 [Vanderwaltozyma polyspora DSM 70294]|uniref:Uncharacterized protein n=1 Tax=Vanderwaltozyma polyspora (strain ATCC 22028 / DSM 70294 / BCRC 21397 / CBS 2163 / NBRC 10782 / NRRL Y-8283 / UCD 57-17) TaxID=436907 RepID=A7TJI9_VANPO|nr:uncharacterized protein Kpol_534p11 [Vanderwaltozyma polyspora DSM 70294]EDO17532.1 hypothetical protein Kpol_534p11 [Vanderwaltozyma polyspora DSM 70294]
MTSASGVRRPIIIEEFRTAIRDMGTDELNTIRAEIENSVRHLERSNKRLEMYVAKLMGEPHEVDNEYLDENENINMDDLKLFQESIRENNIVLSNHRDRLEALNQETIYRVSGTSKNINGVVNNNGKMDIDSEMEKSAPSSIYL